MKSKVENEEGGPRSSSQAAGEEREIREREKRREGAPSRGRVVSSRDH